MNWILTITVFPLVIVITYFLTSRIKHYALIQGITDIPNHRSSHSTPTPRGGGLAVVTVYLTTLILFFLTRETSLRWFIPLFFGGLLIATIGWIDDKKSISVIFRVLVHCIAAIFVTAMVGTELSLYIAPGVHLTSVLALIFAALYIMWMINLYNFMDGIDGIAAAQGVSVALMAALFAFARGGHALSLSYLLLSSVLLGFLLLNWHPAKIFMGDIGSGFVGFILATLALWGESSGMLPWMTATILMGVFIVDATFTLLRRTISGQRIFEAHCSHTYQKMVRRGWTHAQVVGACLLVNIFWLFPWAYLSLMKPEWNLLALSCAYTPLIIAALYFKAGTREV